MRGGSLIAACLLFLAAAGTASAQRAATQPDFPKVPRRVFVTFVEPASEIAGPAYRAAPFFLFTAIGALQPIVRVTSPEAAQSVVRVEVIDSGRGLSVQLLESGRVVRQAEFPGGDDIALATFIDATAKEFAPEMGFVEPRVELVSGVKGAASSAALMQRARDEQQLVRPIELSATAGGLMRAFSSGNPSLSYQATPVVLAAAWYPSETFGLVGSLWTYYGTGIDFNLKNPTSSSFNPGTIRSLFVLPGIGVQYRSLGKIFASLSWVSYAGYLHLENLSSEPVGDYMATGSGSYSWYTFLDANGSRSAFVLSFHLAFDIGIAITPRLLAKTGVSLDLSPSLFTNVPVGFTEVQYLTLGLVYRP